MQLPSVPRELTINSITQNRTTSVKTRATATLRQQQIPPNVTCKHGKMTQQHYL
jgi:hypothetical protein